MNERETPIELIVFDVDGVLARLDRDRRLAMLSRFTGKSPELLHRAIYASDFERSAEAGAYAPGSEYLAELNRRIDGELTREQWIAARRDAMTPIPRVLDIARRLQERIAIATLTNNGALLHESIAEILPEVAELFGASFHASFEFGARKPDPLVFARLARHHDVPSERVLFIDDDTEFLAGARSAGLRTTPFTTAAALSEALARLGLT